MVLRAIDFFIDFFHHVVTPVLKPHVRTNLKRITTNIPTVLFLDRGGFPLGEFLGNRDREGQLIDFDDHDFSFMEVTVMVFFP
jgi:hypothetical protein